MKSRTTRDAVGLGGARLARACEEAPIGIQWLAPDGTVLWANRAAADLAGPDGGDERCKSLVELDASDRVAGVLAQLGGGIRSASTTAELHRSDGKTRHVLVDADAEWEQGALRAIRCFVRDVSERIEAKNALEHADRAALDVLRLKSEFLANISHEIRTPLNGVMGFTQLALDTDLSDEQREYLDRARASAHSLLALINDLLDFSRIDAGKLTLELGSFELRATIEDAVRSLATTAEEKRIEIVCDVAPDVPEYAIGDAARLRQVLKHLVDNAVKFTDRGEVVVRVAMDTFTADARLVLHVAIADTGNGISEERQRAISAPFVQGDGSSTRKHGGLGIGLTIAQELVALMRGRLWIESRVRDGSTFHFTVELRAHEHGRAALTKPADWGGRSALVVAPNGTACHVLTALLTRAGMTVNHFDCDQRGLIAMQARAAAGRRFDLVVIDDRVPGGLELAATIRRTARLADVPIVMLEAPSRANGAPPRVGTIELARPITETALRSALETVFTTTPARSSATVDVERRHRNDRLRVLLAEDDPGCRLIAARSLERRGHTVRAVENGREALKALARGRFDVVLMDIQMPEMDGLTAVTAIRTKSRLRRHLPIVALTAHAMEGDRDRCLEAGMDAYLSKPVDTAMLVATVESIAHATRAA